MTKNRFSPFMTAEQSRRRRELARHRRRARRRAIAIGTLAAVIVGALVVMALAKVHTHSSASASSPRARPHARTLPQSRPRPTRSPIGLPLGTPPLTLAGIGDPQRDSVHVAFHTPPRAGLLFNLDTGQVLWQSNPYTRVRIASLTKMMTALLTVESAPPDAPVLVTKQAIQSAGSKVGVLPLGKHVRLESMLYGLLLPSGNDAAVALAQYVSGSESKFVTRMNARAAQLGMGCTHYSSPSGYVDQYNFSCAADLALLAHVDLSQPRIASIARTYTAKLPFPIKGGHLYLYNNNPLLIYHYPGLTGLKTGYTLAAGRCLVATAERDGVRLGIVLLHSSDPGTQASDLLNRGFEGIYHQRPVTEPPIPPGV
jgi:serine-type D-Ala-D-Ala carboxypeptidase (penicillin-binding protein 5/6)